MIMRPSRNMLVSLFTCPTLTVDASASRTDFPFLALQLSSGMTNWLSWERRAVVFHFPLLPIKTDSTKADMPVMCLPCVIMDDCYES